MKAYIYLYTKYNKLQNNAIWQHTYRDVYNEDALYISLTGRVFPLFEQTSDDQWIIIE
jgi:hypothetical protein